MTRLLVLVAATLLAVPALAHHGAAHLDARLLDAWSADRATYLDLRDALVADSTVTDGDLDGLAATHPDVRVRTAAAVVLGWRTDAALFAEVWTARPVTDRRARRLRFVDDVFADPAAQPAVLERIRFGADASMARAGLAATLIRVGDEWDLRLVSLLDDVDDVRVRELVAWSLRHAAPEVARAGLLLALDDDAPNVRAQAARTAGWRVDGGALLGADLIVALADDDASVRAASARALGWLGVPEAVAPIAGLVTDADPDVRLHALRALDRIEPSAAKALPGLAVLVADADPRVARVATRISRR